MTLVRWEPAGAARLERELDRLFNGVRQDDSVLTRGAWMPPVDIYEDTDHDIVLMAELPEMKLEDIQLTIDRNTLTLRGERRLQHDVKEEQFHRVERSYGAFVRTFSLPDTVDASKAAAEYKDGVLRVRLPRREEAKPKQIQVQVQ